MRQQTAVINAIRAHLAEFQASRFAKRPIADLHDLTFAVLAPDGIAAAGRVTGA